MKRRGILANAGYKLASLIMAMFVWFHVTEHQQFEQVVSVPLRVVNMPRHLAIVNGLPDEVKVRLRAQGRFISFRSKGISVPVDLSDARPGRVTRLLSPADVEVPEGVNAEVVRVLSPGGLILECDSLVTREVRVVPMLRGTPASGFVQAREPEVTPRDIRLRGPERFVGNMTAVPTDQISIENARETIRTDSEVSLRGVRSLDASPSRVVVNIPIEKVQSFELPSVPVAVQLAEDGHAVTWEPKNVKVEIRGARSRFDSWHAAGVSLTIDARDLAPGYYEFLAEPGGGHVVRLIPLAQGSERARGDVAAASGGEEIRALLVVPDFLEVASVSPRTFHLMVR